MEKGVTKSTWIPWSSPFGKSGRDIYALKNDFELCILVLTFNVIVADVHCIWSVFFLS